METFKVQNAGNLAVKYKVVLKATQIETTTDGKSLLDVLEWKVNDTKVDFSTLGNGIEIITNKQLLKSATDEIKVSAHMKAGAGNDYQGLKTLTNCFSLIISHPLLKNIIVIIISLVNQ